MNQLVPVSRAPALVVAAGERASYRFLEFFTAQIRNPDTRRAYARAATEFFAWLEAKGVTQITAIESVHVAAYIEQLQRARSAPTANLRLAALRSPPLACFLRARYRLYFVGIEPGNSRPVCA